LRRTTSLDITFDPIDAMPHSVVLHGRGRDLFTAASDSPAVTAEVTAEVTADLTVDLASGLTRAVTIPDFESSTFVGIPSGGRFRKVVAEHVDHTEPSGNLLTQVLDDVPAGLLIGGSSIGRRNLFPLQIAEARRGPVADICMGWKAGGEMQRALIDGDIPYMGEGPFAGVLESSDDPMGWHELRPLGVASMRRRRRLDIVSDTNGFAIHSMFRDSFIEPDGSETAVHEYEVSVLVDASSVITSAVARPRVLPGPECPGAARSVERLVGRRLDEIRALVTTEFVGATTCTHLNDMCRAIGLLANVANP
jgi:hypothetical protein